MFTVLVVSVKPLIYKIFILVSLCSVWFVSCDRAHIFTEKPVLKGHSKIDKKAWKADGSLTQVESIVEAEAFCNTFAQH